MGKKTHKNTCKFRIEGSFPYLIKSIYKNSTANIIPNGEKKKKKESFLSKIRNETRIHGLNASIQQCTGNCIQDNQARKLNKESRLDKKKQSYLYSQRRELAYTIPKESMEILKLIKEFRKLAGYIHEYTKINLIFIHQL